MEEEDEHSPTEVSIILNIWKLLMQRQASTKARRPKTVLSTNRKVQTAKHKQEDGYWYDTRLRYIEANGIKTRKLKAYLRPSLTTFCRNLFERTEDKRRRIRADDSFQFSAQYKLTAMLRRHIVFHISKDKKSWPEKSLQRSESHLFWHEHGKGNKPQAAQAINEDEALFF